MLLMIMLLIMLMMMMMMLMMKMMMMMMFAVHDDAANDHDIISANVEIDDMNTDDVDYTVMRCNDIKEVLKNDVVDNDVVDDNVVNHVVHVLKHRAADNSVDEVEDNDVGC